MRASRRNLVTEFKLKAWNGVCYGPKITVFLEILASASVLGLNIYVVRKLWIGTIHGLRCPKYGSMLCATIHGLSAQSMDRANEGLEVWISVKPSMHAGTLVSTKLVRRAPQKQIAYSILASKYVY